jgi:signal transduction histidine kinase
MECLDKVESGSDAVAAAQSDELLWAAAVSAGPARKLSRVLSTASMLVLAVTLGLGLAAVSAPGLAWAQVLNLPGADASASSLVTLLCVALVLLIAAVAWLAVKQLHSASRLRQAHLQLHHLGNLLDVWLWRSDAQHRITQIRPPAGSAPDHWAQPGRGQPLWEQFSSTVEASLRAQLDAHAPLDNIEVGIADAAGAHRPARLRATAMTNAQGFFDGYLGVVRESELTTAAATGSMAATDVSATARSSSDAGASVEGALAERPDESLAYTLSHDLRAPIRVVEGFTKILKEDYGHVLDRIGNDHLDRVLGASARMSSMIDALLGLSQLSAKALERQPVNLSQLAAYVAEDLRRQSPQRQVHLHIEPDMQVQGDPTLLRMVLENLLGNAWKYTGKRSDAQIWFERNPQAPRTVFTVRDNGAGFDMRFADRLFGAFQRLHSASEFQGTGVGLVSVRRIVRRHGGDIWAQAEPGQGARFHFTLAPSGSAA